MLGEWYNQERPVCSARYDSLTGVSAMELALPLDQMTVAEKLRAMELLRDDLSRKPEQIPTPSWHADVLAERQRQIDEGQAKFVSWDEFRQKLIEETQ
jgi:hypothetical protein